MKDKRQPQTSEPDPSGGGGGAQTTSYRASVQLITNVLVEPETDNYRGIAVPDFFFEMKKRIESLPPLEVSGLIQDMPVGDRLGLVEKYAGMLTEGLENVRTTDESGDSRNPAGGPPWFKGEDGGYVKLEFADWENGEWTRLKSFEGTGVSVEFYVEVAFA